MVIIIIVSESMKAKVFNETCMDCLLQRHVSLSGKEFWTIS